MKIYSSETIKVELKQMECGDYKIIVTADADHWDAFQIKQLLQDGLLEAMKEFAKLEIGEK